MWFSKLMLLFTNPTKKMGVTPYLILTYTLEYLY